MQSLAVTMAPWGSGCEAKAKGRRWLRLWRTAVTAALGRGERERGRGEEWARESERGLGGAWRRAGDPGDEREKQEVAGNVAARAGACPCPSVVARRTTIGSWASRPHHWAG